MLPHAPESSDAEHERLVEEFMDAARERDPERVAEIERLFVALTDNGLEWRRSREVRLPEAA